MVPKAGQSTRDRMLNRSFGSDSRVSLTSSQSLGCNGKPADVGLQALTAQVRKFSVRIFMITGVIMCASLFLGFGVGRGEQTGVVVVRRSTATTGNFFDVGLG